MVRVTLDQQHLGWHLQYSCAATVRVGDVAEICWHQQTGKQRNARNAFPGSAKIVMICTLTTGTACWSLQWPLYGTDSGGTPTNGHSWQGQPLHTGGRKWDTQHEGTAPTLKSFPGPWAHSGLKISETQELYVASKDRTVSSEKGVSHTDDSLLIVWVKWQYMVSIYILEDWYCWVLLISMLGNDLFIIRPIK